MERDAHAGRCETRTGAKRCGLQDSHGGIVVSRRPQFSPANLIFWLQNSRSMPSTDTALDGPVPPLTIVVAPSPKAGFHPFTAFLPRIKVVPPQFRVLSRRIRVFRPRFRVIPSRLKLGPLRSGGVPGESRLSSPRSPVFSSRFRLDPLRSRVNPARINLVPEVRRLVRAGITLVQGVLTPASPGTTLVGTCPKAVPAGKTRVLTKNALGKPVFGPKRPVSAPGGRGGTLVPGVGPVDAGGSPFHFPDSAVALCRRVPVVPGGSLLGRGCVRKLVPTPIEKTSRKL